MSKSSTLPSPPPSFPFKSFLRQVIQKFVNKNQKKCIRYVQRIGYISYFIQSFLPGFPVHIVGVPFIFRLVIAGRIPDGNHI